jgi:hypothetical protein
MTIKLGAVLLLAMSSHACAMQKSSSSAALEGAFSQVVTDYVIQKSEASSSISASSQDVAKPCSQCPPAWQTSLKVAAAGVVGAGLGEGAYRLGLIKSEKTGVMVGASIGMGAFGGADKLKDGFAFMQTSMQKLLPGSTPKETSAQDIEMKEMSE